MSISATLKRSRYFLLAATALAAMGGSATALAADLDVSLYGSIDLYLNHMRSGSGNTITSLEDGAMLRSRVGFKGRQEIEDTDAYVSFQMEMGLRSDDGTHGGEGNAKRGFDRQSWVGLGSESWGEVRLGRQGTVPFKRGSYIDGSARTLGSMVNNFGVPSRYDNGIAYISPRLSGFQFEAQYFIEETKDASAPGDSAIYSAGVDWLLDDIRVGYAGLMARPSSGAAFNKNMYYHNVYGNYTYGRSKIYLTFIRSNNNTNSASGNNAGSLLPSTGGLWNGAGANINTWHHVWQLAADYKLTDKLVLGAIAGQIEDRSGITHRDANGGSLFVHYNLSDKTRLYVITEILENKNDAGFRPASSGGIAPNFTAPDVNGHSIKGIQIGIRQMF